MKCFVAMMVCCTALVAGNGHGSKNIERASEDQMATLLKQVFGNGSYTVISPETCISQVDVENRKELEKTKKYIVKNLKIRKYNSAELVKALFAYNTKPGRLSLKSSEKDGYLVDYEGAYAKYFEENGGGWEKLRKDHPSANGMTTLSIPAFDKKHNIFLLYIGTQYDYLAGSGNIVAFKVENGKIRELSRVMLWIS